MSPNYIFSQCKQAISSAVIGPRFLHLPSFRVSRLSAESPGHDDNLHSHRRRRFIFPFYFAGANFGRAKFHGRISVREISSRAENEEKPAFSRAYPVVDDPRNRSGRSVRLSSKNLHVRDRPILAFGQVSVPDLRNSSCRAAIYI